MLFSGRLIWNIREKYNISREMLADGLCSVSFLSLVENNRRQVHKLLFESLYQRMGKYSGRFEMLLDADEYSDMLKRWKIYDYIDNKEYECALIEINEYRNRRISNVERQFLCLAECEVMHRTGKSINQCMSKLLEALKYTCPKFELGRIKEFYLSRMEMLIVQQYVRYIQLSGNGIKAAILYKEILSILELERYDRTEREFLYRHVGYWLSEYYVNIHDYSAALEVAEKTYKCIIQGEFIIFLDEIWDLILLCHENKGLDMSSERKQLEVFSNFKKKYNIMDACEYFPRYIEENAYNVNYVISQRRKMHKFTQEKLAGEICDVSTVSLMENNRRKLQKAKKEQLLKSVGLTGDKYVAMLDTYDYTVFEKLNDIRDCFNKGEFDGISESLNQIMKQYNLDSVNSRQYFCGLKNLYESGCESHGFRISEVKSLLSESLGDIENINLDKVILFYNEWNLIRLLILWKKEQGKYDEAMNYLRSISKTYDDSMIKNNPFIYMHIKCRLGDVLGEMGEVEEANTMLYKVLKASAMEDMLTHVRYASYSIAWNILEKKNNISMTETETCIEHLEHAYVIAKIFKNEASMARIKRLCHKHDVNICFD